MHGNYTVTIEHFAERHYIKSFQKKHKKYWDITLRAIVAEFERIDNLLLTDRAEIITSIATIKIIKAKFKIARSSESAKSSGNRCIVCVDEDKRQVSILLVYSKTDLGEGNETDKWKTLVRENYPQYSDTL
jgi:hypothetical protein